MNPDSPWIDPALVWDVDDVLRRLAALQTLLRADERNAE